MKTREAARDFTSDLHILPGISEANMHEQLQALITVLSLISGLT